MSEAKQATFTIKGGKLELKSDGYSKAECDDLLGKYFAGETILEVTHDEDVVEASQQVHLGGN